MDRRASEHLMLPGQQFASGLYEVECSCGWEARQEFATEDEAEDAWENHCDVVFMDATEAER